MRWTRRRMNLADRGNDIAKDVSVEIERFAPARHLNAERRRLPEMASGWFDRGGLDCGGENELFHVKRDMPARCRIPGRWSAGVLTRVPLLYSGVMYAAVIPPSTRKVDPFTNEDSSLARNSAAFAISSARAKRPGGI
jgi:hypothetical protein